MEGSTGITGALTGAMETVQADMMGAISGILPYALGIASAVLVVTLGWKLFKRLSK